MVAQWQTMVLNMLAQNATDTSNIGKKDAVSEELHAVQGRHLKIDIVTTQGLSALTTPCYDMDGRP